MSVPVFANASTTPFPFSTFDSQQYPPSEDVPKDVGSFWGPDVMNQSLRDAGDPMAYYSDWSEPQPRIQQFFDEPQKVILMTGHWPPYQAQSPLMDFSRPYEAMGSIPYLYKQSRGSPSSICSSVTSPGTDGDWGHPRRSFEGCPLSRSTSHISQGPLEPEWPSRPMAHGQIPLHGHINPSDVQVHPDPQEIIFKDDESLMDADMKEYTSEIDNRFAKQERSREHYQHSSDTETSQSLDSEDSPEPVERIESNGYTEADVDAEGEVVDELEDDANDIENPIAEEEEDQDTEYKPKAPRTKRRRSGRTSPSAPVKKQNKVVKTVPRSKSQFQCSECGHSAKDATALARHKSAAHTRPYICTFSFAGCKSTFGNKNEWKRHVSSQHLNLQYWQCDVGACSQSKATTSKNASSHPTRLKAGNNEFNRKDLFTQHLRRMHSPTSVRRHQRSTAEWEDRVKELQTSCLKVRRKPPPKTKCPVRQCGQIFEGQGSWDERMEHVGKHLEKANAITSGAGPNEVIEQESDEFLIEWALKEKIIEQSMPGAYRFYNSIEIGETDIDD